MRAKLFPSFTVIVMSMAAVVSGAGQASAAPAPPPGKLRLAPAGQGIPDSYIVVLKPDEVSRSAVAATAQRMAAGQGVKVGHVFGETLHAFEASMDAAAARRMAADPAVELVEQNGVMTLQDTQFDPPSSGLDRMDQRLPNLDDSYTFPTYADNVRAYVIDSGILGTHFDFFGRVDPGASMVAGMSATDDCMGHGTHVSGTIGGTEHGVAKGVTIVPVRVFGCEDTTDTGTVLRGMEWVIANHQPGQLAVANMSITGPPSFVVDSLARGIISDGVVFVAAAGNQRVDACTLSPGREPGVLTVASMYAYMDATSQLFTNFGPCVDIFAPGEGILSAWNNFDFATNYMNGTSSSAAHATGAAAIVWSLHPQMSAPMVTNQIRQMAGRGWSTQRFDKPEPSLWIQPVVVSQLRAVNGIQRDMFSSQMTAAGGFAPYRWSVIGQPAGVGIDPSTGLLRGTLGQTGSFTVTVTATDALGRSGNVTESWFVRRDVCPTC